MTALPKAVEPELLIAGDSLVAGVGSSAGGWAQSLVRKWGGGNIVGVPGATTRDLLHQLKHEFLSQVRTVNFLVLHIGLNDSRLRPSMASTEVSLQDFRKNIMEIVQLAVDPHTVALVGLHRVIESLTTPYRPDKYYMNCLVAVFDYAIRDVAQEVGAVYVDVPALDSGNMMVDGLHPSDAGYAAIFYRVSSILKIL